MEYKRQTVRVLTKNEINLLSFFYRRGLAVALTAFYNIESMAPPSPNVWPQVYKRLARRQKRFSANSPVDRVKSDRRDRLIVPPQTSATVCDCAFN